MRFTILLLILCACGFDEEKKTVNLTDPPGATIPIGDILPKPTPKPDPKPIPDSKPSPSSDFPDLIPCTNPDRYIRAGASFKGCKGSTRLFILNNGTNANCWFYRRVIDAAVRKGYYTVCPNSAWTGSGEPAMRAIRWIMTKAEINNVLITGHSQGGAATVAVSRILQKDYPYIKTGILAIQPAWWMTPYFTDRAPKLPGRKIIACGSRDTTVPCAGVYNGYRLFKEPKEFHTINAGHLNPQREWIRLLNKFD